MIKKATLALAALVLMFLSASPARAESWTFVVMSDSQGSAGDSTGGVATRTLGIVINDIVKNVKPELIMVTGDLVQGAGTAAELEGQLMLFRKTMAPAYDAKIPVYAIRGSHDTGPNETRPWAGGVWNKVFAGPYAMPGNGPADEKGLTYSFTHKNAFFLCIDGYKTPNTMDLTIDQTWVDAQLAANKQPHVLAFQHTQIKKVTVTSKLIDKEGKTRTDYVLTFTAGAKPQPQAAPAAAAADKVRVAVLGDSLSTDKRWPPALAKHLGEGYDVKCFASGGATLLRNMDPRNVWRRREASHAREFRADVVLMMFGAIEGRPKGWPGDKAGFIAGYKDLIKMFQDPAGKRKIYLLLPPAAKRDSFGGDTAFFRREVVPVIQQIAKDMNVGCIDTHTPFIGRKDANEDWDGLHPTAVGNEIIARTVANELTGSTLALPERPKEPTAEELAAEQARLAVKAAHVVTLKPGDTVELTPAAVADPKGDGPDGKGNTEDDTWGFWFGLIFGGHHRLTLPTATLSANQRANGIVDLNSAAGHQKKVTGPVAGELPNPNQTNGWIFNTDWNGKFEGFWGDLKAPQILAHPYVEKSSHSSVSVTFRVAAEGTYDIAGKITDLQVFKAPKHDGVSWIVEVAAERVGQSVPEPRAVLGKGGPVGDKVGPDSAAFEVKAAPCKKGDLIRLVISPNDWWGTDLTRIDYFRITRVK
ncbi:MAG: GDSL-type esterase/lipase family protein [Planctomycetaceae bacterium]|nr:GDSL-type esterase/lipase family protein [Planctomycetaceae bacterium]